MREKSFRIYISKLLKQTCANIHITKLSSEAIDSITRVISDKIVSFALLLTSRSDKKTVSASEIETSVRMILPSVLASTAVKVSTDAVNLYKNSPRGEPWVSTGGSKTRESRCGLIFSVSASEKYIRRFGQVGYNVSATAPVFLASVLENLISYLLTLTSAVTKQYKKSTISVRHIFLAVNNDENLRTLFTNLGITFLESGVVPQQIQNKKRPRISRHAKETEAVKSTDEPKPKTHRWRPGIKTTMQIRRLQKDCDTLIQHAPFNRLVREIAGLINPQGKLRFTEDFFTCLQSFCEDRTIQLMKQANATALYNSRETVYARDVEFVGNLLNIPLRSEYHDHVSCRLPEASIRHLAHRAGILRFGDCSKDIYFMFIVSTLTRCLSDIISCTVHHNVSTLNTKLFIEALNMRGIFPTITATKRKTVSKGKADVTNKPVPKAKAKLAPAEEDLSDVEASDDGNSHVGNSDEGAGDVDSLEELLNE